MRCWKRHRIATDSSVEKRLEIEASSETALTSAFGYERRIRCNRLQSACATGLRPGLPGTDLSSARRFHQITRTSASAECGSGSRQASHPRMETR
jgi:hypothetical protein